jgi:acetyl-CoA acetyltransferase
MPSAKSSPNAGAARARPDPPTAISSAISEQIALVDAASAAVSAGAGERALAVVREYQTKYPTGSFRPEISALRIEALVLVGRREEARTLAQRFVTQYQGPLAERVARVAGLSR